MKTNMFIPLCALLLLFSGVGNICCETVMVNSIDVLSLLDFRQSTIDPGGILSNWNSSTSLCQWNGVQCNPKHPGRVTGLNLSGQRLSGTISASVGNLTSLRTLDLSHNQFSGEIPHLNNLQNMRVLNLSYNSLVGKIPDTLTNCSKLTHIGFKNNFIKGEIPLNLDLLPNLFDLVLSDNNLTGTIPPSLANISHAERIALAYNDLTGTIPDDIWKLPNLKKLLLGGNKLSGKIPQVLSNLSSLERLGLELNMLGKALPQNIGDAFPNIQELMLNDNHFESGIPASLGNASRLERLDMSTNNFSGQIPSSLGRLGQITILSLQTNNLEANDDQSWSFLHALANCTALEVLALSENQLYGVIPSSIANLSSSLSQLYLGRNMLTGVVPPSIGNLQALIALVLRQNNLYGTIEWVGKLTKLQLLSLQQNNFTGQIPSSIGNLTQVVKLVLWSNKFEGSIPSSLENLQQSSVLDLSDNNFSGQIPNSLGRLIQLLRLGLSSNKLTGEIPDAWKNFQIIQFIGMAQNCLTGNIPLSFGNLSTLSLLNLSHNDLSGVIPTALESLRFSKIDLSYNRLQGPIPVQGIFENVTAVSLDGNLGLCGGATGFHMPPCPYGPKRRKRTYYLVEVLIPIFGFMSLVLLGYFLVLEKKMPGKSYLSMQNLGDHFPKVSYNDLAQATRNFSDSNLIGRGSCGSVYKGKLKETKMEVAVKVFNLDMLGAERSFMSECEALRSVQHRNLLSIITACSTVDGTGNVFKALVYEFMPNGNLDTWLHHNSNGKSRKHLGLNERICIAVNIADVLDYLHHDCGRPTIHCDVKPSNILLDDEMNALLGDFGISRFYADSWVTTGGSTSSVGVKGTIGYIAPEYGQGGHVSTSGDVYSFGILLLEMITGKRPTDPVFKDGLEIINFVEANFPDQMFHVIDVNLLEDCKSQASEVVKAEVDQCLASLLELALLCTRPLPSERPDMKQIASKTHSVKASYLAYKCKK